MKLKSAIAIGLAGVIRQASKKYRFRVEVIQRDDSHDLWFKLHRMNNPVYVITWSQRYKSFLVYSPGQPGVTFVARNFYIIPYTKDPD